MKKIFMFGFFALILLCTLIYSDKGAGDTTTQYTINMTKQLYSVLIKNESSEDNQIILKDGDFNLTFSAIDLISRTDIQPISTSNQKVSAEVNGDSIIYRNIYGEGIDYKWTLLDKKIKFLMTINPKNVSLLTKNLTFNFNITYSKNLELKQVGNTLIFTNPRYNTLLRDYVFKIQAPYCYKILNVTNTPYLDINGTQVSKTISETKTYYYPKVSYKNDIYSMEIYTSWFNDTDIFYCDPTTLLTDLIAYYTFDDGTFKDSVGVYNGTIVNSSNSTGLLKSGRIYNKNATDYLNQSYGIFDGSQDFSISLWFYANNNTAEQRLFQLYGERQIYIGLYKREPSLFNQTLVEVYNNNLTGTDNFINSNNISMGQWYHVVYLHNASSMQMSLFLNKVINVTYGNKTAGSNLVVMTNQNSTLGSTTTGDLFYNGTIDEIGIWNKVLTASEISQLYNDGNGLPYPFQPEVIFDKQLPTDITNTNMFVAFLNITYNISNSNASLINFFHKTNSTVSDIFYTTNGTGVLNYTNATSTISNVSNLWKFSFGDNQIYPATYNYDENEMEDIPHTAHQLTTQSSFLKIRLFNVSEYKPFSMFEIMLTNKSSIFQIRIYYCNSSYTTGQVVGSAYCTNFYNIVNPATYNHSHSSYSKHFVIPFTMNGTGYIGNIKVTDTSFFLVRGNVFGNNVSYITNLSRADTIQTTTNNGVAWANLSGTANAHLHQYNGTDTFYYYVCANSTYNNTIQNCSTVRSDLLEFGGLPPTSPNILSPSEGQYNGNINISYTSSLSPNNYDIVLYNISLLNINNYTLNKTIILNNSVFLNYTWDSSTTTDGEYYISVQACDSIDQCSYGYSDNITLNNSGGTILVNENTSSLTVERGNSITISANFTSNSSNISIANITIQDSAGNIGVRSNLSMTLLSSNISAYANVSFRYTLNIADPGDLVGLWSVKEYFVVDGSGYGEKINSSIVFYVVDTTPPSSPGGSGGGIIIVQNVTPQDNISQNITDITPLERNFWETFKKYVLDIFFGVSYISSKSVSTNGRTLSFPNIILFLIPLIIAYLIVKKRQDLTPTFKTIYYLIGLSLAFAIAIIAKILLSSSALVVG